MFQATWLPRLSAGAVALTGIVAALSGCEQPRPRCSSARGEFSAIYTLRSPPTGRPCEMLHGEILGVQTYTAPRSATDSRPDYDKMSLAIEPATLTGLLENAAERAEPHPEDKPYARGPFAESEPAADDFCTVPTLHSARVRLPALAEQVQECTTLPPEEAVDISYTFRNVRVYTTAGAYGTQFAADLTYTQGDCTAEYAVRAVYPAVPCGSPPPTVEVPLEPLDGGMDEPVPEAGLLDAGLDASAMMLEPESPEEDAACPEPEASETLMADDTLCSTMAGLNPDFAVRCDPELLLCVLEAAPPSLRE